MNRKKIHIQNRFLRRQKNRKKDTPAYIYKNWFDKWMKNTNK